METRDKSAPDLLYSVFITSKFCATSIFCDTSLENDCEKKFFIATDLQRFPFPRNEI